MIAAISTVGQAGHPPNLVGIAPLGSSTIGNRGEASYRCSGARHRP
jgi:hypothetical protein